jgi:tetratricopeptide (TPR) repeat protein
VHARRAGAVQEEARLVDEICTTLLYGPAPVNQAIARCETLLADSRESRVTEANVSSSLAGLKAMRGDFDEARACATVSSRVYSDLGLRFALAGLSQISGSVESLAGDPEAAEREFRKGYEILAEVGARGLLAAELAQSLVDQGRMRDAAEYVAVAEQASGGDIAPQVIWRIAKARISAVDGKHEEAIELASEAVELADETDALTMSAKANLALAEALRRAGLEEGARAAAEHALELYAQKGHTVGERRAAEVLAPRLSPQP